MKPLPITLSFFCGFIGLSCEILWVRLLGFAQQSTPQAFGFVLFCYIIGIAIGAHIGKRICLSTNSNQHLWGSCSKQLFFTSALIIVLPAFFSWTAQTGAQLPIAVIVIVLNALVISVLFPILHHLGVRQLQSGQGAALSSVYFSNILGACTGPLITGYLFLDLFTLQQTFVLLALITAFCGIIFSNIPKKQYWSIAVLVIGIGAMHWHPHWLLKNLHINGEDPNRVIETRQGIITLFSDTTQGDAVYGGNVYDGRTNLNGDINSNGINRILLTSVLQPNPKKVLMIGLSIGTWLAIVKEFPGVESIDVIEINPGYLEAIKNYPEQNAAVHDSRVKIHIDDARRWLKANSLQQYDLIIMNTTWSWRSYITLLLSQNFMKVIRTHMAHNSIFCFNSTDSDDAFYTAAQNFDYAYKYKNFVYASNHDFRNAKNTQAALELFQAFKVNQKPIFKDGSKMPKEMLDIPFLDIGQVQSHYDRKLEVITDQNMITEFKYGRSLLEY